MQRFESNAIVVLRSFTLRRQSNACRLRARVANTSLEKQKCGTTIRITAADALKSPGTMALQNDDGVQLAPTRLKPPPLYTVLLLNDDYTPMEFVIAVLQQFFSLDQERATRVMLQVHTEGKGVCGVFPKDIAATKVDQVQDFSRQHQHPLQCVMEEN